MRAIIQLLTLCSFITALSGCASQYGPGGPPQTSAFGYYDERGYFYDENGHYHNYDQDSFYNKGGRDVRGYYNSSGYYYQHDF